MTLGAFLAAGISSTFAVLRATALLSLLIGPLPSWSILIVAFLFSVGAWVTGAVHRPVFQPFSPVLLTVPILMVLHSYISYRLGFGIDQDPAVFRAWYNADWFKHLGHTHSLSNFGLPARDIFGGGAQLNYYWLFYLLPASIGSIFGDINSSLIAVNLVIVFYFWLLVVAIMKALGLSDGKASIITLVGWAVFTMNGTAEWIRSGLDIWNLATTGDMKAGLLTWLNMIIPQHIFMAAGLLSFGLLWTDEKIQGNLLRWIAIAPIVAAGATSLLLGVSVVGIAGLSMLFIGRDSMRFRFIIAAVTGLAAVSVVMLLHVVDFSFGSASLASPIFSGAENDRPIWLGLVHGIYFQFYRLGLALPLGLWGLVHGFRNGVSHRPLLTFCLLMFATSSAVLLTSEAGLKSFRLIAEIRHRSFYPVCLALLIGMGILLRDLPSFGRSARSVVAAFVIMILLALPSNVFNLIWQGWSDKRWQVIVPSSDIRALHWLRANSEVQAVVLQFPEPNYLMGGGRDTWVPIFAGRTIYSSYRDTNWVKGSERVEIARRFYEGKLETPPFEVNWVYLSRTLHPATYDQLLVRLRSDVAWRERYCNEQACLFSRATRRAPI